MLKYNILYSVFIVKYAFYSALFITIKNILKKH